MRQGPALLHARRSSRSTVLIAASAGHQCQPSALKPRAAFSPIRPIGTGGMRGERFGGYPGSPAKPAIPMAVSFRPYYGSISKHENGQSSATTPSALGLKSDG